MPNFKSGSAYKKWVAYGHIHKVMDGKGRKKVTINGRVKKVNHATNRKKK